MELHAMEAMNKHKQVKMLTFRDNKGKTVTFPGNLTIEDMVRLGMKEIGLHKPGDPVPDNWYVHQETKP